MNKHEIAFLELRKEVLEREIFQKQARLEEIKNLLFKFEEDKK